MTRGRNAQTPTDIPTKGWLDIIMRIAPRIGSLHIGLLAAGIAFYGLLSIFPAMTAGVALVGLVFDPAVLVDRAEWILALLPEAAGAMLTEQLSEVAGAETNSLTLAALLSLAIAL